MLWDTFATVFLFSNSLNLKRITARKAVLSPFFGCTGVRQRQGTRKGDRPRRDGKSRWFRIRHAEDSVRGSIWLVPDGDVKTGCPKPFGTVSALYILRNR